MKLFLVVIVPALASATANPTGAPTTANPTAPTPTTPINIGGVVWGNSEMGGDSSSVDLSTGVKSAMCGDAACVAVMTDESAVAWGNSDSGGDSSSVDLSTGVKSAMCGDAACVAVMTDESAA